MPIKLRTNDDKNLMNVRTEAINRPLRAVKRGRVFALFSIKLFSNCRLKYFPAFLTRMHTMSCVRMVVIDGDQEEIEIGETSQQSSDDGELESSNGGAGGDWVFSDIIASRERRRNRAPRNRAPLHVHMRFGRRTAADVANAAIDANSKQFKQFLRFGR